MLIDGVGTEYSGGRIILPKDWIFRPKLFQWWEPQACLTHYKIVARGIGGVILWQGNFLDLAKALRFWQSLNEIGPAPHEWDLPTPSWHPGLYIPGVVYEFATVQTFNSTPGGGTWTVPAGVTSTDWLAVAAGGGGGSNVGGGGGAGGLKQGTGFATTPSTTLTVTIGAGGTGLPNFTAGTGTQGGNTVFASNTSTGGGGGGGYATGQAGQAGGSGGGGSDNGLTNGPAGLGGAASPAGQGNAGGRGFGGNAGGIASGGGGGGAGAAGGNATSAGAGGGGPGGNGLQLSISGTPTYYAGGGAGNNSSTPGLGGGGTDAVNGAANTGGGGGTRANGGSGIVILSYTARFASVPFRRTTRFYTRRF